MFGHRLSFFLGGVKRHQQGSIPMLSEFGCTKNNTNDSIDPCFKNRREQFFSQANILHGHDKRIGHPVSL